MAGADDAEVRAAVAALAEALAADDATAWVSHYCEDAVFVGPGEPPVAGRDALTQMATSMAAMSAVSIRPERIEASGALAATYVRGSWSNGPGTSTTSVRSLLVWRKEATAGGGSRSSSCTPTLTLPAKAGWDR